MTAESGPCQAARDPDTGSVPPERYLRCISTTPSILSNTAVTVSPSTFAIVIFDKFTPTSAGWHLTAAG